MSILKKTINVYWTSDFNITSLDPDPALNDIIEVHKNLSRDDPESSNVIKCPSIKEHLRNTFRIKSPTKIDIRWDGGQLFKTSTHDQKFFDNYILIRDNKSALLTYRLHYTFFTEEPSLIMEQRQAQYSFNDFTKNTSLVEGQFDIGKWYRNLETAFFIKESNRTITLDRDDPMYYLKFHTEKNINFVKFNCTPEIANIRQLFIETLYLMLAEKKGTLSNLHILYKLFEQSRYKKYLLNLIKQNVIE